MWVGFCAFESTLPFDSKSHAHTVGFPDDVSVKLTERGAFPVDGVAVKDATGATAWVTVICAVSLSEPAPLVAVRVTV